MNSTQTAVQWYNVRQKISARWWSCVKQNLSNASADQIRGYGGMVVPYLFLPDNDAKDTYTTGRLTVCVKATSGGAKTSSSRTQDRRKCEHGRCSRECEHMRERSHSSAVHVAPHRRKSGIFLLLLLLFHFTTIRTTRPLPASSGTIPTQSMHP